MSVVNITNIQVLNNPAKFDTPFAFEITFECISPLKEGELSHSFVASGVFCFGSLLHFVF